MRMSQNRTGLWMTLVVLTVVFLLSCSQGNGTTSTRTSKAPDKGYSFEFDGVRCLPDLFSLAGTPQSPREGDVICINDFSMVLGPPGKYSYQSDPENQGRLFRILEDGSRKIIAIKVGWTFRKGITWSSAKKDRIPVNALKQMTPAEIASLRGIVLQQWSPDVSKQLLHIDVRRTCITIQDKAALASNDATPQLPDGLQYLHVYHRTCDAKPIGKYTELRYLDLRGCSIKDASSLSSLVHVCALRLEHSHWLDDADFMKTMKHLVVVDLQDTGISDLSPLGSLEHLVSINASECPLTMIPKVRMPQLSSLRILATGLHNEMILIFSRLNPQCRVHDRWGPVLKEAVKNTTRIRVRADGTGNGNPFEKKTLFEVTARDAIEQFRKNIVIIDAASGFHCQCYGEPSIEFYNHGELIVTLSVHHGVSLRWPDGWPSDGVMTDRFASYVCQWLADNGVKGPKEERDQGYRGLIRLSGYQRLFPYHTVLPTDMYRMLRDASSTDERVDIFEWSTMDPVKRAKLCLEVFGVEKCPWDWHFYLDWLVKNKLLPRIAQDDVAEAIRSSIEGNSSTKGAVVRGSARWFFAADKWRDFDKEDLEEFLPVVAEAGLSHPSSANRRMTLVALRIIGTTAARDSLRKCFRGKIVVEKNNKYALIEPDPKEISSDSDDSLPSGASDRALAALQLARMNDQGIADEIREQLKGALAEDKEILKKALGLLESQKKPKEDQNNSSPS